MDTTQLSMAIVHCDPSQPHHVIFRCQDRVVDLVKPKAEELLPAIITCLAGQTLTGFRVINQSESFTMIRVLATIMNALAYTKDIQFSLIPHYHKDAV